jgi:predicted glycosyltransferase
VSGPACLLWVQSLLGSGHLRRALAVAEALAGNGFRVALANGGPPSPWPAPRGVRLAQLPPVASRDLATLLAADGTPAGPDLWGARRERLLALLDEVRPAVLVTEMFPFGRRAFRGELLPLLARARELRPRPLVLASVRDVLVGKPDPAKYLWMLETFREGYDAVLVHGDPALFPFGLSFPLADELGPRVLHTGFVLNGTPPGEVDDTPAVLVSAGGGAVGAGLLATALDARPLTVLADRPWLLVAGGNLAADRYAALAARAAPPVRVERHRPDLAALIGRAGVSVSQAGYNTVAEGLASGARMVLVPFAEGGEDEQTRRAARLAGLGLALHLPEAGLDARSLAAAIDRAAALPRPDPSGIALDGASRTARLVRDLLARRRDA